MRPTLAQRLNGLARNLTPFALTLVLLIVNVIPTHVPGLTQIAPILPLMAVYHWSLYRPELLPPAAIFVIGVLQDALTGLPIGLGGVIYLILYWGIVSQRRFLAGKSFVVVWLGFAVVAAAAQVAYWIAVSAYYVALTGPQAVVGQYLLTVGCFPFLGWFLLRWQMAFLRPD